MGERFVFQVGNFNGQGPVNVEIGSDGVVDHGSLVGPDDAVHNVIQGEPSGVFDDDGAQHDGAQAPSDAEGDGHQADDELSVVEEDIVTRFDGPNGSTTNVVAKGARVGGRIIQLGDVHGDIHF